MSLYEQLELTRDVLRQDVWPDLAESSGLPPNVIPFRPRRSRERLPPRPPRRSSSSGACSSTLMLTPEPHGPVSSSGLP
jgi:hypothetical protein